MIAKEASQYDGDSLRQLQRVRQSADMHLLRVIQVARDLKRPPVNVVVKQAEQLNIANQQQVNVDKAGPAN